jgi:multicomponent Na+:H+ antiporter subunit F
LLPPLAVGVVQSCRGRTGARLVAVQLASSIAIAVLMLMTFSFDQSSFTDLPLCLALLTLPGTLLMAMLVERWL